jgi:hypothetical protein
LLVILAQPQRAVILAQPQRAVILAQPESPYCPMESNISGMALLDQNEQPVIFEIPGPRYMRAMGLIPLATVVGPIAFFYSERGVAWTLHIFDPLASFPSFFLTVTMAVALAIALWILFPPRSSLARFEFMHDRVRFIPNSSARFFGETSEETPISPQSVEVLVCHRYLQERPNGWRVVVRAANGAEGELGRSGLLYLSASNVNALAEAITSATGIPVRVIIRRKPLHGAVEETPWTPPNTKTNTLMGFGLASACLPFVGGIIMGWLSPRPAIVVVVGLALWLCMMLALLVLARTDPSRKKFPTLYSLTTLVTFSATYAVCFVVTAYLVHPH